MQKVKEFLTSKKFWAVLLGVAGVICEHYAELPKEIIISTVSLLAMFIAGYTITDIAALKKKDE